MAESYPEEGFPVLGQASWPIWIVDLALIGSTLLTSFLTLRASFFTGADIDLITSKPKQVIYTSQIDANTDH